MYCLCKCTYLVSNFNYSEWKVKIFFLLTMDIIWKCKKYNHLIIEGDLTILLSLKFSYLLPGPPLGSRKIGTWLSWGHCFRGPGRGSPSPMTLYHVPLYSKELECQGDDPPTGGPDPILIHSVEIQKPGIPYPKGQMPGTLTITKVFTL